MFNTHTHTQPNRNKLHASVVILNSCTKVVPHDRQLDNMHIFNGRLRMDCAELSKYSCTKFKTQP